MNGWSKTTLIPILAILLVTAAAVASSPTTFTDEPAAKQHCLDDTVVPIMVPFECVLHYPRPTISILMVSTMA
jgi:hypothetical protein